MTPDQLRTALRELNGERAATFALVGIAEVIVVHNAMLIPDEPDHLVKVTDGQNVYFHAYVTSTTDDSVFSCPTGTGCTTRTILATGQHFSYATAGLAGDNGYAYWTAMNGKDIYVRKCAATGCNNAPTEVAHIAASTFSPWVGGVALDKNYAYFLLDDGGTTTVYRVVK